MTMKTGERQVAQNLEGIRRDHVARYEWASRELGTTGMRVIDFGCGVGYGTKLLADAGHLVYGFDRDRDALEHARTHFMRSKRAGRTLYRLADAAKPPKFDAEARVAIAFEILEHLANPRELLVALAGSARELYASVPNEAVFPWRGYAFHERHYTRTQFEELLNECGWHVTEWWGQEGEESEVERDLEGRTLIVKAKRGRSCVPHMREPKPEAPAHVTILGFGPSLHEYLNIAKGIGGREAYCDQVWAINALGNVVDCDLLFHMDDVRVQERRAEADPAGNIAPMVRWLKRFDRPGITSRPHTAYPALSAFPLEEVVNELGFGYFNSTAAYAVAYAIWLGVKKISLYGLDFTYANSHRAEKGRACVEFWLGMAAARGIKIAIPVGSSLMDACAPEAERFYGYDTVHMRICRGRDRTRFEMTPRAVIPTAEEIERRYDHTSHPNPLVKEA